MQKWRIAKRRQSITFRSSIPNHETHRFAIAGLAHGCLLDHDPTRSRSSARPHSPGSGAYPTACAPARKARAGGADRIADASLRTHARGCG